MPIKDADLMKRSKHAKTQFSMIKISHPSQILTGEITLDGSKSISNRILIIQKLGGKIYNNPGISSSVDTQTLFRLLQSEDDILDAGAAGTTLRFLTSYLALTTRKTVILTGTKRMQQRPIGPLVDALNFLGANIEYVNIHGFPPLRILPTNKWNHHTVSIPANMSSQFLSSILLIAPYLPEGIILKTEQDLVSRPYLEMTLELMKEYGVSYTWKNDTIRIAPGKYEQKPWQIEADWSAASYYYSMVALAKEAKIKLFGLHAESTQGDRILPDLMQTLGVCTKFIDKGIVLTKNKSGPKSGFSWNFIRCPDLAQSIVVCCSGLNIPGEFKGLQTLYIKETDRVAALQNELAKINVHFTEANQNSEEEAMVVLGKMAFNNRIPEFSTYEDHRMAMAFTPLSLLNPIVIHEPEVVKKSYPAFWEDCSQIGFVIEQA